MLQTAVRPFNVTLSLVASTTWLKVVSASSMLDQSEKINTRHTVIPTAMTATAVTRLTRLTPFLKLSANTNSARIYSGKHSTMEALVTVSNRQVTNTILYMRI